MKKVLISFVLIFTIITTFSSSVFAYYPATNNGTMWETEPNDYDYDATIFYQTSSAIYLIYGAIRYTSDYDFFVYRSKSTKARTLRLGFNSRLTCPEAQVFLTVVDATNGNEYIYSEFLPTDQGFDIPFQAIAGHDYIIGVNLEGPSDIIQEKIDELAPMTGGAGWRYPLSIR